MDAGAFSEGLLGLIIRLAGLFGLLGAFALVRQIRMEMMLDRMTSKIEGMAKTMAGDAADEAPGSGKSAEEAANARWKDRDDAARRGWIAGQAVVLIATALAMILLHRLAAWLVALLVMVTHRANIKRLIAGTEPRVGEKKAHTPPATIAS